MPLLVRTTLRTKVWPWFVLAAVLLFVGALMLRGTPQVAVSFVAVLVFLAACIRKAGLSVRDNAVGSEIAARRGLVGGVAAGIAGWMAEDSGVRRRAAAERRTPKP
jgi:hypothetical protein